MLNLSMIDSENFLLSIHSTRRLIPKQMLKARQSKLSCLLSMVVFTVDELLQYDIINSAFFLVDIDGYLRKSIKSQLGTELLKLCPIIDTKGPETSPQTNAIIIDFMAFVRKVPL